MHLLRQTVKRRRRRRHTRQLLHRRHHPIQKHRPRRIQQLIERFGACLRRGSLAIGGSAAKQAARTPALLPSGSMFSTTTDAQSLIGIDETREPRNVRNSATERLRHILCDLTSFRSRGLSRRRVPRPSAAISRPRIAAPKMIRRIDRLVRGIGVLEPLLFRGVVISPGSAGVRLRIDCFSAALGLPSDRPAQPPRRPTRATSASEIFQSSFAQTRRTSEIPHAVVVSPESVVTSGRPDVDGRRGRRRSLRRHRRPRAGSDLRDGHVIQTGPQERRRTRSSRCGSSRRRRWLSAMASAVFLSLMRSECHPGQVVGGGFDGAGFGVVVAEGESCGSGHVCLLHRLGRGPAAAQRWRIQSTAIPVLGMARTRRGLSSGRRWATGWCWGCLGRVGRTRWR